MRWKRPILHDARLLFEALVTVVRVRVDLWRHRHDALRKIVVSNAARFPEPKAADRGTLAEISWAVAAAARLVPQATCLTQATSGQLLLARRGIDSTVRLSLPIGGEEFRPHAWLMSDNIIVLGGTRAEFARHTLLKNMTAFAQGEARP